MSLILPSYQSGFAPRDYEPAYPSLWQGCVAAYAPLLGPTGLVLRDSVGKNDGVLIGGPTWDISGGRYALGFDGSNDYVNCGNPSYLSGASFLSISIWLFPRTINQFAGIATKDPATGGVNRFGIFTGFSGTEVLFACGTGNDYGRSGSLVNNAWNHIVFVFDGTKSGNANRLRGYINGQQLTLNFTGTISSTTPTNSANFGMMTPMDGGTYANARGDDLRVYTRTLTDQEVLLLASRRGIAYEPRRVRVRYFRGFSPKKKLLEAKITSTIPGSFQTGYAPRDGEPVYPELWKGCVGAWSAGLGPSNILRDNSPAKNHGTLVNGPTYQVSGGQYAINMDGTDDGILTEAQGPATKNRSVSLWFNTAYSVPSGQFAAMLSWNEQNSNSAFQVLHGNGGNLGANGIGASQWGNAVGVTGLNDGKWHHLVIVNADQLWSIYADGIFRNSATLTTTPASNKIAIGRTTVASVGPGSNQNFAGLLDDIRVYSRALSPNEIKLLASQRNIAYAHRKKNIAFRAYDPIKQVGVGKITSIIPGGYHTGVGGLNNEPAYPELTKGLVGGWCPSLGVTGGVLRDNSGQGNHGVLTNMDPGTDWVVSGGKYALDFDGVNDWVNCGDAAACRAIESGLWTVSSWVYSRNGGIYFGVSLGSTNSTLVAFYDNSVAQMNIIGPPSGNAVLTSASFPRNQWVNATWVMSDSGSKFYLNGAEQSVVAAAGTNTKKPFNANSFNIASLGAIYVNNAPTGNHSSQLGETRVYSRPLQDNEIRLLASRRGIGYDYKSHRSYSKTQSSGLLKRLILTGQT